MDRVKSSGEGAVVAGALSILGRTPVQVEQKWLDLFAGRATAVVTNIAGPRDPVALAGVPLAGFTAWVPSTGPVGIGLAICSYAGQLLLGVAVDEALLPEPEQLLSSPFGRGHRFPQASPEHPQRTWIPGVDAPTCQAPSPAGHREPRPVEMERTRSRACRQEM